MSIRGMRVVSVAVLVALLCLTLAIGTSAEPRADVMAERVAAPLLAAREILMKEMGGECSPGDKRRVLNDIEDALHEITDYQRQSH